MALYAPAPSIPNNIDPVPSPRGTVTTFIVGQNPVVILQADIQRKGFSIYNSGGINLHLGFNDNVNLGSDFFVAVPPQGFYEWSMNSIYTGVIFAYSDGEGGSCQVGDFGTN